MLEALGLILSTESKTKQKTQENEMRLIRELSGMSVIPELWRHKDQELKTSLNYI